MSLKDLALTYRTHLKSSMARQAQELGFESTRDMIKKLFNKSIQESYGVETSTINMLYLTASTFRRKAQQRSANAPMLQFRPPREGDYDNTAVSDPIAGTADKDITADDTGTLTHTGWVRARKEDNNESGEEEAQPKLQREFTHLPLSACLRISQKEDVDTGRVHEGKILAAIVFDYDQNGDGGSPLLTLSLNAAGGARQRMKIVPEGRVKVLKGKPEHPFTDLAVGDGPYRAKVVKLVGKKQRALVDVGVGRELSNSGGKTVQVLGTLRYQDSKFRSKRLQVGEYIDVYVSSVTAQSNQFRVTTNPLIKGQKAKDVKKDEGITKKMNRLKKDGGLNRIYTLTGTECDGIVKAASKTGDWVYVQPQLENLPVGIGELDGDSEELKGLSAGDNVRVRISGIDEERGQLSMKVISKL
ncbi:hypothetical protein FRACYDRAFT_173335 [Fragilariopsis cylindrus CCMP1102]|uniref:Uncharacterized protein n=1 Tax=Fragilariopsis cylindrus CCMP1102 TaxID=635003 RepID=A0A1E7EW28_9STRA|nr:hypothetical protein FRACYDRAFT_173335 [Fragilariopsis cylindrus CCMP1102]|eukprot:OEU10171.1 hypothetical protein FRACYDRAFT_173335 [Fragilariopsis cylindrus CCMP1102]